MCLWCPWDSLRSGTLLGTNLEASEHIWCDFSNFEKILFFLKFSTSKSAILEASRRFSKHSFNENGPIFKSTPPMKNPLHTSSDLVHLKTCLSWFDPRIHIGRDFLEQRRPKKSVFMTHHRKPSKIESDVEI